MSSPSPVDLAPVYRRYLAAVVLFHARAASAAGIGATDYQASSILSLHDTMTAGELGSALGLTSGATTRLIDRLVAAGLARRVEDPEDRRRVRVADTGAMTTRMQNELDAVRQPIGETISALDAHQLRGLAAYFASATTAYESAAGQTDGSQP